MRLAFLANKEKYFPMADVMIDSARAVMPGITVVHLTDKDCPEHAKADKVFRAPEEVPFGMLRTYHHSHLHNEWLFVDVDIVFQRPVWDVFDDDFDIACASRVGTPWQGTRYADVMPYNNGVVFSRCNRFWLDLWASFDTLPQEWFKWGEQLLFNNLVQREVYRLKVLPCSYNFTPFKQDQDVSDAHILHYKGGRKSWMGESNGDIWSGSQSDH